MSGEVIVLNTLLELWERKPPYIKRGVTAAHLIRHGLPYSKSRCYHYLSRLTAAQKLEKVGRLGGYVPKTGLRRATVEV